MALPLLIIEFRPRLQVGHVFIKAIQVDGVDLEAGSMTLRYQGQETKVTIPGLDFKPKSVANFTLLENGEGTYFRMQTGRCPILQMPTGALDFSAKNTSYLPDVEVESNVCVECVCCQTIIVEELCFQRILPLPSDSWDASEMFCHAHGTPPSIAPRAGDLLYGPYNFILPIHTPLLSVNIGTRVFYCDTCDAWLGTRGGHYYTLWNSTVMFVKLPLRNETQKTSNIERREEVVKKNEVDSFMIKDENETIQDKTNKVLDLDESSVIQNVERLSLRSLNEKENLTDGTNSKSHSVETENILNVVSQDKLAESTNRLQKTLVNKPEDIETEQVSSTTAKVVRSMTSELIENIDSEKRISSVTPLKGNISEHGCQHQSNPPPTTNSLHTTALQDFINVVRDNIGINSKILIHCQVSDTCAQYLLLWVMDRNLSVCTYKNNAPHLSIVMKALYRYAKAKPAPDWENDLSLAQVSVSKRMFLSAVEHIREQNEKIPAAYRCLQDMRVTYLVVE